MSVLDLKKERKDLYSPPAKDVSFVDVPEMRFLMIDGQGDPNTAESYKHAIEALFTVSYTLKFMCKKAGEPDYAVMPLEGLWWTDGEGFDYGHKDAWRWTMMIAQPDFVMAEQIEAAIAQAEAKKDLPALAKLRFEAFREGPSAQIMYVGPYADEGPTIERVHAAIRERGCRLSGKHHEIYLGDSRRSAPEKLKTVIRQPYQ
jgi:hypothetical protein